MAYEDQNLDLIIEYRKSIKKINQKLAGIEKKIDDLPFEDPDFDLKLHDLMIIKSDLKYFFSNLQYALYWMETGYALDGKQI